MSFLSCAIDGEGSQLPLRPVYPVLVEGLLEEIRPSQSLLEPNLLKIDDLFSYAVPPGDSGPFSVLSPDGKEHFVVPDHGRLVFKDTTLPGHYKLLSHTQRYPLFDFSVNLSREEGEWDLTPLTLSDLKRSNKTLSARFWDGQPSLQASLGRETSWGSIGFILVPLIFCLLLLEWMIHFQLFKRNSHEFPKIT